MVNVTGSRLRARLSSTRRGADELGADVDIGPGRSRGDLNLHRPPRGVVVVGAAGAGGATVAGGVTARRRRSSAAGAVVGIAVLRQVRDGDTSEHHHRRDADTDRDIDGRLVPR